MELVLDLHLHSRFSRAVSPKMNIPNMHLWARKKGINVLTVADFTHPLWFREIKNNLVQVSNGIYEAKDKSNIFEGDNFFGPYFVITTELSSIYSENGIVHKIHNLVCSPSIEIAEKINTEFKNRGFNLNADGRPILGISSRNLADLLFSIDKNIFIIPCHIWTPWFSLYGSRSGYDRINDCFGEFASYIYAVETGLSSDPSMNWRIKELDGRSIVSFSDAHSLEKMGREATVLTSSASILPDGKAKISNFSYSDIVAAFKKEKDSKLKIAYTIEFYPEEGKYHYTGHRLCGVSYSPQDVKEKGKICPKCRRELTVGVMDRVEKLASNSSLDNFVFEKDEHGVSWVKDVQKIRPSYVSLVPLLEVLAEALDSSPSSVSVLALYDSLVAKFGSEHEVLFRTAIGEIAKITPVNVSDAIRRVRERDITIVPGFDGEYGKVSIKKSKTKQEEQKQAEVQLVLGFEI